MRYDIIVVGLILSIGCKDDPTGPGMPDLSGQWRYSATNLRFRGGGVTCNVSGVTLSIAQTGETLTGTYSGGTMTCSDGSSDQFAFGPYSDLTGSIAVRSDWGDFGLVRFDLDQPPYDWTHRGTVSGSSMGGGVSMWGLEFCDEWGCREELWMSGDWMATR